MLAGFGVSGIQCTAWPLSFFTSNWRRQCGLDQSHSATRPFIVSVLLVSNTAVPWCAKSGIVVLKRTTATADNETAFFPMGITSISRNIFRGTHLALS